MRLLISILPLALCVSSFAKEVEKKAGESDLAFVARVSGEEAIDNQIARSKILVKGKELLIAFTVSKEEGMPDITTHVFTHKSGEKYDWAKRISCETEGGQATVESFFFANADKSPDKEIVMICTWPEHGAADCHLPRGLRFFKVPTDPQSDDLVEVNDDKFKSFYRKVKYPGNTFECDVAKFREAGDVKKLLKAAGF